MLSQHTRQRASRYDGVAPGRKTFQRIAAAECVHYLMGVAAVTNLILVKPTATWAAPGVSSVVTEIAVVS